MATGTDAGLTRRKRAQSVYKHHILLQYVLPFAAKTASYLDLRRCVITDGFGGRARYDDGSAGSAERMMVEARKLKSRSQVDVFLVEKDKGDFAHLDAVADEYRARGVNVETRNGDCVDYLDEIVSFAKGASLFLSSTRVGSTCQRTTRSASTRAPGGVRAQPPRRC
jgi:three-Cys-motif partner protein